MADDVTVPFDNNVAKRGSDFIVSCDLCDMRILASLRENGTEHQLVGKCRECDTVTRYALTDEQFGELLAMRGPLRVRVAK